MEKWVQDWHARYRKIKSTLENNNNLNEDLFEELASECDVLLETWMEMEDKLDDIKELKDCLPALKNNDPSTNTIQSATQLDGPIYFQLEIYDKAVEKLKKEIKVEHKNELILYLYLGFSCLYEGKINEGKEAFLFVIHTSMNKMEKHFAYVGLGCLYGRTHHFEEAIHYFEKANSLYINKDVPYNIGMAYVMMQKYKLALPYLEKAVEENREDGEALYFLGHCYLKSGNETNGFEAWYTALQHLEYKDLLVSIAYEFENLGYYSAAIQCYKRLEALGYKECWVYHGIAWNYGLLEEKEIAINMFEALINKHWNETNLWISFLWLLSKWKDNNRLRKWVNQAKYHEINHPLLDNIIK